MEKLEAVFRFIFEFEHFKSDLLKGSLYILEDDETRMIKVEGLDYKFFNSSKSKLSDYIIDLNDELESIYRVIMLQDDDGLTAEAIKLKYQMLKLFKLEEK